MRTPNLSAAIFRPSRSSYWSQSDRELVTPDGRRFWESIKPFATGPLFVPPPSPPFWRH